jgi:hypothetical protein
VTTENYEKLRRCTATTKNGESCKNWAVWGDPNQLCASHGGKANGKVGAVCNCVAYPFPHRPGGGLCMWPDQPTHRLVMEPSTHASTLRPAGHSPYWAFHRALRGRPPLRGLRCKVSPSPNLTDEAISNS